MPLNYQINIYWPVMGPSAARGSLSAFADQENAFKLLKTQHWRKFQALEASRCRNTYIGRALGNE